MSTGHPRPATNAPPSGERTAPPAPPSTLRRWVGLLSLALLPACSRAEPPTPGATPVKLPAELAITRRPPAEAPDRWQAAFDAALALEAPFLARDGVRQLDIGALEAEGQVLPYLMVLAYPSVDPTRPIRRILLADPAARLVNLGGGAPPATAHLAAIGFPARPRPARLVAELLSYFRALPEAWCFSERLAPARFEGNLLVVEAELTPAAPPGGGFTAAQPHRLEVQFAADATFTVQVKRRAQADQPWQPAP